MYPAEAGDGGEEALNLQSYTPSALLKPGQVEIKVFNNLYTQTASFNSESERVEDSQRSTYFGTFTNVLYGVSSKINIGFDLYFKSVDIGLLGTSPLNALAFNGPPVARAAFTKFGPRIKVIPFTKVRRLSLQSTLLFPTAKNLEGKNDPNRPFLDWDTYTWLNQLFFDKSLSSKFQLFTALEVYTRFPRNGFNEQIQVTSPVKAFLSYFPNKKITVYGMMEFAPQYGAGGDLITAYYTQTGVGGKYQLFPSFEIESLVTVFPLGKNQGAGSTYNLGVRYIR